MSSDSPRLLYLANCGVLVEWNGAKILLDGLYSAGESFDPLPRAAEDSLLKGRAPYNSMDLLLYTHLHFDHFDMDKTLELMENQQETRLVAPSNIRDFFGQAQSAAFKDESAAPVSQTDEPLSSAKVCKNKYNREAAERILQGRALILDREGCGSLPPLLPGAPSVEYLRTGHITFDYPQHYCYRLSDERTEILFAADMDFDALSLMEHSFELSEASPGRRRYFFFNPLLLGKERWVDKVASWKPDRVFIYHLPAASIDCSGYRRLALRRLSRYAGLLPQLDLLLAPMSYLKLDGR